MIFVVEPAYRKFVDNLLTLGSLKFHSFRSTSLRVVVFTALSRGFCMVYVYFRNVCIWTLSTVEPP